VRIAATLLALVVAGCAIEPPRFAGYPFVRDRERDREMRSEHGVMGDRESGPISAEYNLMVEADESGSPTAQQILRAHAQRQALVRETPAEEKAAGLQPSQWQALGPSNVGGRVRALAFDPRNSNRLLAGTASGGLWITEDAGNTWRANQDFLPNLSITTIAFDPANPDVVYMGTGEASGGLVGIGAFKSTDGGRTWAFLPATSVDANLDWRFVNRIAVNPAQTQLLLAGVTNDIRSLGGIYRSADAGATWSKVSSFKALDVAFDPNNASRALAGLDDGTLAYSSDAGLTWTKTSPLVSPPAGRNATARAEIAFAHSQSGVVYASLDNLKGQVWRSDNSGATWRLLSTPAHLNNQGDYDNAIWVDPTDANHVVVAGLDIYQSRDGGNTFTQVSDWRRYQQSPHADHHQLVSPPGFGSSKPFLYDTNDGGIYVSTDIYAANLFNWTNLNNGLAVTQFYSGSGRTAAGGRIIGGAQDNYSLQLSRGFWSRWMSGDGGNVQVDPTGDQVLYGEYVYASVHRSLNGGINATYICTGISEAIDDTDSSPACGTGNSQKANFIAPLVLDPNSRDRLYVGAASLWVTDDPRSIAPTWRTVKDPSPVSANYINAIAVAEGDPNTVWVGHNNGEVWRTTDATSAIPTWTRVGQGVIPARLVNRIAVDRDDRNHVIVAVTGFTPNNVWETRDGGATWSSITGNLPHAPVFDVKRHARKASWLYAATSVGVYTSEDGGATWSTSNEGPANIRVRELFWIDDTTLGAATYGRGMFKVTVAGGAPDDYQDLWWSGPQENGWGMSIVQHRDVLFSELFIYDNAGNPIWVVMPGGSWNASFTRFTGPVFIPAGSWFAAYDASRHNIGPQVGTVTLDFASHGAATLTYTINGVSGTKSLTRIGFGPPDSTPVGAFGDLWWGGTAQNGWGIAINQQYRTLFSLWYTYDRDGKATWLVMPAGAWTAANTYSASAYRASGPPWLGVPYDPSRHSLAPVGNVTVTFTDAQNAVMTYTIDGVSGTNALTRVPF
jgi:photosystem II stability/assembly factor-like uncharacterized protein